MPKRPSTGTGPAEDPSRRVPSNVVETTVALLGQLVDDVIQRPVPQDRDGAAGHEQQQRAIRLDSETAHDFALVELLVLGGGRIVYRNRRPLGISAQYSRFSIGCQSGPSPVSHW